MSQGSDKRRFTRHEIVEPALIVVPPETPKLPDHHVLTETLDVSDGGARLRHPNQFISRIGERFDITSAHIGPARPAQIIESSAHGLHVEFEEKRPLVDLDDPS